MKTNLFIWSVVAAIVGAPLASATVAEPELQPICVFDPQLWDQDVGNVCAQYSRQCVTVWAAVYSQTVATNTLTAQTNPIDVGPVHISGITLTVDGVHIITTPQRGFTNTFCVTQVLA